MPRPGSGTRRVPCSSTSSFWTCACCSTSVLFRRKRLGEVPLDSKLRQTLGLWDLTALGVGSTLGAGVYVVVGAVAREKAGPAIILSFVAAGLASILAGLGYSEFASRVPRAGSSFIYAFYSTGEFVAWVTGWSLALEYIIGAASVARAWSGYTNELTGGQLDHAINGWVNNLQDVCHVDFVAFAVTIGLSALVAFGVQESTTLNNWLTVVNLLVVAFVIVAGLSHAQFDNWSPFVPPEFGFNGVLSGASTAFYSYIGFDVIASSAEEAKRPDVNIPLATLISLSACCLAYVGVAASVTLMVPYDTIDVDAPLSAAFNARGMQWAQFLIGIGAIAGLSTSLAASLFPLPRIIYSIAQEGLLPPTLATISTRTNTPLVATAAAGLFVAVLALVLTVEVLADLMSVGTLLSYTVVSACVVVLRYEKPREAEVAQMQALRLKRAKEDAAEAAGKTSKTGGNGGRAGEDSDETDSSGRHSKGGAAAFAGRVPRNSSYGSVDSAERLLEGHGAADPNTGSGGYRAKDGEHPTREHFKLAVILVLVFAGLVLLAGGIMATELASTTGGLAVAGILGGLAACIMLYMHTFMPQADVSYLSFMTPFAPILPMSSMAINLFLMCQLSKFTWMQLAVWSLLGAVLYFLYGVDASVLAKSSTSGSFPGDKDDLGYEYGEGDGGLIGPEHSIQRGVSMPGWDGERDGAGGRAPSGAGGGVAGAPGADALRAPATADRTAPISIGSLQRQGEWQGQVQPGGSDGDTRGGRQPRGGHGRGASSMEMSLHSEHSNLVASIEDRAGTSQGSPLLGPS